MDNVAHDLLGDTDLWTQAGDGAVHGVGGIKDHHHAGRSGDAGDAFAGFLHADSTVAPGDIGRQAIVRKATELF